MVVVGIATGSTSVVGTTTGTTAEVYSMVNKNTLGAKK